MSGIGTSVAIIEYGLKEAGYTVDVVITGHTVGSDLRFAEQSGWNVVSPGIGERFLPLRLRRVAELLNLNDYSVIINNTSIETQIILPCLRAEILRVGVMRVLNRDAMKHISTNSEYLHTAIGISAEMTRVMKESAQIKAPVRLISNSTKVKGGAFPQLNDNLKICYVGRISNRDKNVNILPRIAKILKASGIKFTIQVVGDGRARKSLEKKFKKLAPGCVSFKGLLPRERAQQIMSKCNFVFLPSISEGLSNVMLEGMAFGCVPVCSDIENFKWVLGKVSERLMCRLHVPEDYAKRISYMVNNLDAYKKTQMYLRERQQRLFTPNVTVQAYLDMINELRYGKARELPATCSFQQLEIPKEYLLYCSPVWRLLQKIKNTFRGYTAHRISD